MQGMQSSSKICWVFTGAGHFLRETVAMLPSFGSVDIFLTRAAREVAARYRVLPQIEHAAGGPEKVHFENDYSASPIVYFSSGKYGALVIAPATANTVAKCVLGIADSLASNFFAQAGKSRVPIFVLPTDVAPDMTSVTPTGRLIEVAPRPIDLHYTDTLESFPGISVSRSPGELERKLKDRLV